MVARDLAARRTATLTGDVRLRRADGSLVWTQLTATPQRDRRGKLSGLLLQAQDVEDRRSEQAHLQRLAEHDPLTGVLNRRSFGDRLREHSDGSSTAETLGALFVVDLDDFKAVNDTFGHATGDELLRTVAASLSACLRNADSLGRIGGDEFAFLLGEGTGESHFRLIARRVERAIARGHGGGWRRDVEGQRVRRMGRLRGPSGCRRDHRPGRCGCRDVPGQARAARLLSGAAAHIWSCRSPRYGRHPGQGPAAAITRAGGCRG